LEDNEGKLDKDSVGRLESLEPHSVKRMERLVSDLLYFLTPGASKNWRCMQPISIAVVHDIESDA